LVNAVAPLNIDGHITTGGDGDKGQKTPKKEKRSHDMRKKGGSD